jgi:predicted HTH transcriptional regulator
MSAHAHSIIARDEGQEDGSFSSRERTILDCIAGQGSGTDRQIMRRLGFIEPNSVRPRISELIEAGQLLEVGSTKDSVTGKTVRIVGLPLTQASFL